MAFLGGLFESGEFLPHSICLLARPMLVWSHAISDAMIALAYYSIPVALAYFTWKRKDLAFRGVFLLFAAFILACGTTHIMGVWTLWDPQYGVAGAVKIVTAMLSVVTAALLWPLMPKALALPSPSQLALINRQLSNEILERRQAEAEIARKNEELERLLVRVNELDQMKSRFFANISHELRTPLALILGPCEAMLADASGLSPRQRRDMEVMRRNASILLRHVNDLLDIAKLNAGQMRLDYAEADLAALVRTVCGHFDALASQRGIRYTVETPELVPAQVDSAKVERILLNLVGNAFKFVPNGGSVTCRLTRSDDGAVLTVDDSGPGIKPEFRESIFERFRQGDGGSTRPSSGTGLGLSIAREFTELHLGTITVGESPAGGARFEVHLPVSATAGAPVARFERPTGAEADRKAVDTLADIEPSEPSEPSATPIVDGIPDDDRPIILVAEDNRDLRCFIVDILGDGARVVAAADGLEGHRLARQFKPDLVVTDIMMPRLGGDELIARLRDEDELRDVPVLVLSARADDSLRVKLLERGAQDYMVKPFSGAELRARTRNLIEAKRARDVMQAELASRNRDLAMLARDLVARKRELQTAVEALGVARDQAVAALDVKGRFLRLVSHELRSPLTGIQFQLALLHRNQKPPLSERQQRYLAEAERAVERMGDLVTSLLEYTRLETGLIQLDVARFDVAEMAAEVIDELQPRGEIKGVAMRLERSSGLLPLQTDRRLLRLVLVNLVDNAVKYMDAGRVTVRVTAAETGCRITVVDTGPGISPDDQLRIFEPFHQLDNVSHKHTPGVGLGLAVVKQLVATLRGELAIDSKLGQGTTFTVTVPDFREESEKNVKRSGGRG